MHIQTNPATGAETQTSAAGRVAVLPAGVEVGGVTPWSSAVTVRVSAKVGLQVCQRIPLWRDTVSGSQSSERFTEWDKRV